ncbi:MAG: hypothetical protein J6M63_09715 [Pseudobutyrivibrio sp.]|nr:hypothetical protein [Pseudobutyrivibrio sp.]
MKKKILSIIICITLIISFYPNKVYAEESESTSKLIDSQNEIITAPAANSVRTVDDIASQWKFNQINGGHGFAAEQAEICQGSCQ